MEFTAQQIAETLNGTVEGNPEITINRLSKIEEGTPGSITFLANPHYTPHIYTTGASIVVVNSDFVPSQPLSITLIRVENAYMSFARLLELYNSMKPEKSGISPFAVVAKSAKIGEDAYLGEFVVIGENTLIGKNSKIYPHTYLGDHVTVGENTRINAGVKIYEDCVIGNNCTIHSGVVIGADGFGFAPQPDHHYKKIVQTGNVIIEDDVEIGANTTIDRATLGSTIIRKGAKLDNLVMIAHNVEIGENSLIIAQVGIAGTTKIGKNCVIAGQAGIVGHLVISDNVKIGAQSGIEHSIPEDGATFLGSPAIEAGKARRNIIHLRNIDNLVKRVNELEKLLKKKE
jgi:UDP-3-O-[3-hydroxymyristoyl] glucosamine N-acyltransferase